MSALLIPARVAERAATRYTLDPATGCHVSTYSSNSTGYAQIGWQGDDGRTHGTTAHRAAWTAVHGSIPGDLTVDHLCRNRRCVNVAHMRLLTNYENAKDGSMRGNTQVRTHCWRGHDKGGAGPCPACGRINSLAYYHRARARKAGAAA